MTEAGDAGWDLSWYDKLTKNNYAGAILITKAAGRKEFMDKVLELNKVKPCIIHAGVTGWGRTMMEPGVQIPLTTIQAVRKLIDRGFPAERIVLRVDPIIPTEDGIQNALDVLELAKKHIPDVKRIRISIYDDYHKAREEMMKRGFDPIDNITKWKSEAERRPTKKQVDMVAKALIAAMPEQVFECCAEPEIAAKYPEHFVWTGCLSQKDCDLMGVEVPPGTGINGQNRFGCRCLMMKTELLSNKKRCPNNCAYCYWGRN